MKCQQETAISPGLDPQTVEMIRLIQTHPLGLLMKLQLKEDIAGELKPVLKLHREYHLGRRPKTANYVE